MRYYKTYFGMSNYKIDINELSNKQIGINKIKQKCVHILHIVKPGFDP